MAQKLLVHLNNMYVLDQSKLPQWFTYPKEHLFVINETKITSLVPWHFMKAEEVLLRIDGLKKRYPNTNRIPFAYRQDNDDIACWDKDKPGQVCIIHDFASNGWEEVTCYNSYWQWFDECIKEMKNWSSS